MMNAIGKQIWETRSRKRAASRPELSPQVIVDCGSITCGPTNVSSIDPWKRKCHVTNTIDPWKRKCHVTNTIDPWKRRCHVTNTIDPWKRKCHVTNTIDPWKMSRDEHDYKGVFLIFLYTSLSHRYERKSCYTRKSACTCDTIYVFACGHPCVRACVRTYILIYVRISMHANKRVCVRTYVHACIGSCAHV